MKSRFATVLSIYFPCDGSSKEKCEESEYHSEEEAHIQLPLLSFQF